MAKITMPHFPFLSSSFPHSCRTNSSGRASVGRCSPTPPRLWLAAVVLLAVVFAASGTVPATAETHTPPTARSRVKTTTSGNGGSRSNNGRSVAAATSGAAGGGRSLRKTPADQQQRKQLDTTTTTTGPDAAAAPAAAARSPTSYELVAFGGGHAGNNNNKNDNNKKDNNNNNNDNDDFVHVQADNDDPMELLDNHLYSKAAAANGRDLVSGLSIAPSTLASSFDTYALRRFLADRGSRCPDCLDRSSLVEAALDVRTRPSHTDAVVAMLSPTQTADFTQLSLAHFAVPTHEEVMERHQQLAHGAVLHNPQYVCVEEVIEVPVEEEGEDEEAGEEDEDDEEGEEAEEGFAGYGLGYRLFGRSNNNNNKESKDNRDKKVAEDKNKKKEDSKRQRDGESSNGIQRNVTTTSYKCNPVGGAGAQEQQQQQQEQQQYRRRGAAAA